MSQKKLDSGTTASIRVTLSDGKLTHDAQFQPIDIYKPVFRGAEGTVEKNFRDSYKFNIAAYRLGKLIGIEHSDVGRARVSMGNRLDDMVGG